MGCKFQIENFTPFLSFIKFHKVLCSHFFHFGLLLLLFVFDEYYYYLFWVLSGWMISESVLHDRVSGKFPILFYFCSNSGLPLKQNQLLLFISFTGRKDSVLF